MKREINGRMNSAGVILGEYYLFMAVTWSKPKYL
jgi:hypothetical protein